MSDSIAHIREGYGCEWSDSVVFVGSVEGVLDQLCKADDLYDLHELSEFGGDQGELWGVNVWERGRFGGELEEVDEGVVREAEGGGEGVGIGH